MKTTYDVVLVLLGMLGGCVVVDYLKLSADTKVMVLSALCAILMITLITIINIKTDNNKRHNSPKKK